MPAVISSTFKRIHIRYTLCNALYKSVAWRYTMYADNSQANPSEDREFVATYCSPGDSRYSQSETWRRDRVRYGRREHYYSKGKKLASLSLVARNLAVKPRKHPRKLTSMICDNIATLLSGTSEGFLTRSVVVRNHDDISIRKAYRRGRITKELNVGA